MTDSILILLILPYYCMNRQALAESSGGLVV